MKVIIKNVKFRPSQKGVNSLLIREKFIIMKKLFLEETFSEDCIEKMKDEILSDAILFDVCPHMMSTGKKDHSINPLFEVKIRHMIRWRRKDSNKWDIGEKSSYTKCLLKDHNFQIVPLIEVSVVLIKY